VQDAPDVVVLGGREPSTADEMARLAKLSGLDVPVARYSFWKGDRANPDLTRDVAAFARRNPAHVIAKSIGSLIVMLALRDHGVRTRAALFLGVPVKRLRYENRIDLLSDHCRSTPTSILQRRDDPTGSFADLARALGRSELIRLHELPGDTHDYADEDAAALVRTWWAGLAAGWPC